MSKENHEKHGNNPWSKLKESLRTQALSLGFDVVGFAAPIPPPGTDHLRQWIASGHHGSMTWMESNLERRLDPGQLVPGTGVVMTLGVNYRPATPSTDLETAPHRPRISASCRIDDYHQVLKQRLRDLEQWLEHTSGHPLSGRVFVDTAPVMEKPLAMASGLGWQGKNTLLVSRQWGCWLFLGEYFLPLDLPPDPPATAHCGRCDRCCTACPTGALDGFWGMDARRCIAYLTIESRDPIPRDCRRAMGNRIAGCDDCLNVCPWNRFATPVREPCFRPRPALTGSSLLEWAHLDEASFRRLFAGTSIRRIGRTRFMRNLAIALGNWGTHAALTGLSPLLKEPEPLIRGAAVWGLSRIAQGSKGDSLSPCILESLSAMARTEKDPQVLQEIQWALSPEEHQDHE
ncbi:MAG: tRNA epoxyqueuosine(34) reductase QueG [Magnetococcales bacterium]|nr:tRNA epoxyqueuosine(34) reductase QueG [Magnetococcales bacterium]